MKIIVWEMFMAADWPLTYSHGSWRGAPHPSILGQVGFQHAWDGGGKVPGAGWGATHGQDLNYLFADGHTESIGHMEQMSSDEYFKVD